MPTRFSSFAQNFEDVILWRALRHIDNGFYVDVGAAHPVTHSVSLGFYENDWRGIHIEPNPELAAELRLHRPDETVIEAVVGANTDNTEFHVFAGTGLSTGVSEIAERHAADGRERTTVELPTLTLASILADVAHRDIHWLKIDVEGMELDVLDSWGTSEVRPWIVVIESTEPLTSVERHHLWEDQVTDRGYAFAYFDGLNRFYVHEAHAELLAHFGPGPNLADRFTVTRESAFADLLTEQIREAEVTAHAAHEAAAEQNRNFADTLASALGWVAQVDSLEARVLRMETVHDTIKQERDDLQERLTEATDQLHHAEARAHGFEAEAWHLREIVAALEGRIDEILASTSWKVTGPVRALGAMRHRGTPPPEAPAEAAAPPAAPPRTPESGPWTVAVDDDTVASFNRLLTEASDRIGPDDRG